MLFGFVVKKSKCKYGFVLVPVEGFRKKNGVKLLNVRCPCHISNCNLDVKLFILKNRSKAKKGKEKKSLEQAVPAEL